MFLNCSFIRRRTLSPASVNWIIYSVALYGTMFIVILRAATREMACLQGQVRCLTAHMAVDAVQSLRDKHSMFLCFLVLAFCELLLEGSCRYMLAAKHVPFLALLLVYELVSTGILLGVGWSFRPRQYSPFHFMVPTSLEYAPVPPVPTMLGGDEGEGEGERVQGGWLGGVWASRDERDIGLRSTRNNEQTYAFISYLNCTHSNLF